MATSSKQSTRTGRSSTAHPPAPSFPSQRRAHSLPPMPEPEDGPSAARPRDRVSIAVTLAALVVLAGVLVTYVVMPAVRTLAEPSVTTWSGDGP